MTARDREYDRFGPWVLAISDDDPPPALFLSHPRRTEAALLTIKIPRRIERRKARPGMNLYDYVVSLYEHDMVIHERVGHDVRTTVFRYADVQHLRVDQNLLRGSLHLAMDGIAFELPYNTVSNALMDRVIGIIRGRYVPPGSSHRPVARLELGPDTLSFYFERLLHAEQAGGTGMQPLAIQPETAVGSLETSLPRRVFEGLVSRRLLETMHLSDGRELKIVGRGTTLAYRWQSVYGRSVAYLPTANLTAARWSAGVADAGLLGLELQTRGGSARYAFSADNPTVGTLRAYLEALA